MRSSNSHTSPLVNIRNTRQGHKTSWSFRAGVGIDVKFGMTKYNCRFHGICQLDIDESDLQVRNDLKCGTGKGWLFIPRPDYCLIWFDKCSLTDPTRETHFHRIYFELEEAVPFSEKLALLLGRQLSLQAGQYRVLEKVEGYCVLFEVIAQSEKINAL